MKNIMLYGILSCLIICSVLSSAFATKKQTNWNKSFRKNSKDPYGTYLAYQSLTQLFPKARIKQGSSLFSKKNNDFETTANKVCLKILIANDFDVSSIELEKIMQFVEAGNYLFFAAENMDAFLLEKFSLQTVMEENSSALITAETGQKYCEQQTFYLGNIIDSDRYTFTKALPSNYALEDIEYDEEDTASVPDEQLKNNDYLVRNKTYEIWDLGGTAQENINFMMVIYGKGRMFFHTAPLLFTNYFLLQKNNRHYFEKVITDYIPAAITEIEWHEFLYRRRGAEEQNPNSALKSLFKYPMWRVAIFLIAFGLLFYILFNGKRKQREVPIINPLSNTSKDFAETIGQLYYNNQDHKNIADKMIAHFLENVRSNFNLNTNKLDDYFIESLHKKSGASNIETSKLIDLINSIKNKQYMNANQLTELYISIQNFKKHYL